MLPSFITGSHHPLPSHAPFTRPQPPPGNEPRRPPPAGHAARHHRRQRTAPLPYPRHRRTRPPSSRNSTSSPPSQKADKEIQPADFARTWLEQIDAGQYEKNYSQFDESGKANHSLNDWTTAWSSQQKQFGAMYNRQHQQTESCRTVQGLPNGDYTRFSFKAIATAWLNLTLFERIILAKQPDTRT